MPDDPELLLRELTAEARAAEHCPQCFDRHGWAIIRRLLTRTESLPVTEDHPT